MNRQERRAYAAAERKGELVRRAYPPPAAGIARGLRACSQLDALIRGAGLKTEAQLDAALKRPQHDEQT